MLDISYVTEIIIQAASGDDPAYGKLGLLFLASGFVYFGVMFFRYRNTNQRHRHESETKAVVDAVQGSDVYARSVNRQIATSMRGANNKAVRGARNSWF